jgi:hypothetical protein
MIRAKANGSRVLNAYDGMWNSLIFGLVRYSEQFTAEVENLGNQSTTIIRVIGSIEIASKNISIYNKLKSLALCSIPILEMAYICSYPRHGRKGGGRDLTGWCLHSQR